jgi:hypothetical protein
MMLARAMMSSVRMGDAADSGKRGARHRRLIG